MGHYLMFNWSQNKMCTHAMSCCDWPWFITLWPQDRSRRRPFSPQISCSSSYFDPFAVPWNVDQNLLKLIIHKETLQALRVHCWPARYKSSSSRLQTKWMVVYSRTKLISRCPNQRGLPIHLHRIRMHSRNHQQKSENFFLLLNSMQI